MLDATSKKQLLAYGFQPANIHPPEEGLRIVGVFVGHDSWVTETLRAYIEERVGAYHRAEAVACVDKLLTYQLFSLCYVQRVTHLARTHPPRLLCEALRYFDVNTAAAAAQCLQLGAISHDSQVRASLPPRYGGIAIRSTQRIMHGAFVCALGAAAKTDAFTKDPALAPHVARFVANDQAPVLQCFHDWNTAAATRRELTC